MKVLLSLLALLLSFAVSGCAVAQMDVPPTGNPLASIRTLPPPLRLDEVVALSRQGVTDDAVIAEIEQRGAAFVLSPQDFEQQRAAGISDGVLRYLQGRASAETKLRAYLLAGRYRVPAYSGAAYLGYPYLGYYDGLHSYGAFEPGYYHRDHYLGHYGGHLGGHGGHHGGHH